MCDISYRQTKAGWKRRKQGGAKEGEEGRDGITQRRRRKRKQPLFFFSLKVSGTEKKPAARTQRMDSSQRNVPRDIGLKSAFNFPFDKITNKVDEQITRPSNDCLNTPNAHDW